MLQNDDVYRALHIWGPIRLKVSKKSIELWGKIKADSVINFYNEIAGKTLFDKESLEYKYKKYNR